MLVDTHFHLDLMPNMHALITEIANTRVGVIAVGTTPRAYGHEVSFVNGSRGVRVALGLHPQLVAERGAELKLMLKLLPNSSLVGEIGLDFSAHFSSSKEEQLQCFRKIVRTCNVCGGKTLSIHSVRSAATVIEELEVSGAFKSCRCILHWFTGTPRQRSRAIEDGAYFSINPRMLGTKSGRETIRSVPVERMLLETDAPFVSQYGSTTDLLDALERLVEGISAIRGTDMSHAIEENSMCIWNGC